jgi:lipid II isoglutaminyl synthase (glutamine-hydrolysing)
VPEQSRNGSVLRVCVLYPDLMNIYADRGNLLMLERRCAWRGLGFELLASGLGEPLDGEAHDLYYVGGGQDREDLVKTKGEALRAAAARDALVLGVCGGYQLLGHSYILGGERIEGVGLLDAYTVREDAPRLIGNVAIEVAPEQLAWPGAESVRASGEVTARRILAGFENHGGRTRLGGGARPLGQVLRGFGNDGRSGFEGAVCGSVIGTYLHGPLLPKNSWFADWLIARALRRATGTLAPLADGLEQAAHDSALRAAGV